MNNWGNVGGLSCYLCPWLCTLFTHQGIFCFTLVIGHKAFQVSHTHHLLGNLIRFLFIDVPWLVDLEFRLWYCCFHKVEWDLAEIVAEVGCSVNDRVQGAAIFLGRRSAL